MPSYTYIDTQDQLDALVKTLAAAPTVAVDTESSSFFTYVSELCLMQITSQGKHFIIDTRAGLNMDGLGGVFASTDSEKIFHAAGSDLAEIRRMYGWSVRRIFDTMIAAQMLGLESRSLAGLVLKYEGRVLEKKEQKSDWRRRPLTKSQLDYANLDTVFLESLRDRLWTKLVEYGFDEEIQQEFELLTRDKPPDESEPEEKEAPADGWMRINGSKDLPPRNRGVLAKLYEWRDAIGRKENLAVFRVTTNESLLRVAQRLPSSIGALESLRILSPSMIEREGRRILTIVEEAEPVAFKYPKRPETDPVAGAHFKELKMWRQRVAEYRGMDYALILSNKVLWAIAAAAPKDVQALRALDLMSEWKIEHYGSALVDLAAGRSVTVLPKVAVIPHEHRVKKEAPAGRA
ncbi:MAG: HRDC domain-containing protein [Spirochaetia bacterium]|nr:HRDC domain-containing protein [Spirochaetia bacterium]